MSNHVDSLFAAVSVMAGHGNIKQRLVQAYEEHLAPLDSDELPLELCETFAELRRTITRVEPMNGEGPVCASVRKMSIGEADECAGLIVRLYGEAVRLSDNAPEMLSFKMNGRANGKPLLPPFLVRSTRAR